MAVFSALSAFSSAHVDLESASLVDTATKSTITVTDLWGTPVVGYEGSFTYKNDNLSGGSVKKITYYQDGEPLFNVTGAFSAKTLQDKVLSGDTEVLQTFLFAGNDTFRGSTDNDVFSFFGAGADTYFCGDGDDFVVCSLDARSTVNGEAGDDILIASGLQASVNGGSGDDYLIVGAGANQKFSCTLTGGVGDDYFEVTGNYKTTITDFTIGSDTLYLSLNSQLTSDSDFAKTLFDLTPFGFSSAFFYESQVAVGAGLKAARTQDERLIYDSKAGVLYLDKDGLGGNAPSQIAVFKNKPAFTADTLSAAVEVIGVNGWTGPLPNLIAAL